MRVVLSQKSADVALMPCLPQVASSLGREQNTDFRWPFSDHAVQKYPFHLGNLRFWQPDPMSTSPHLLHQEERMYLNALYQSVARFHEPHFALLRGRALVVCPDSRFEDLSGLYENLDFERESEAILDILGFPPAYTEGLDAIYEEIKIFSSIRKYHPIHDFIEELVPLVSDWVVSTEKSICEQIAKGERVAISHKPYQNEAMERIDSRSVSYEWLMSYYHRLAIFLTPPQKRNSGICSSARHHDWISHEDFMREEALMMKVYCDLFEKHMAVPTAVGQLGIFAMNRMFEKGLCPIGLIFSPTLVHGNFMYSDEFANHDQGHYENIEAQRRKGIDLDSSRFLLRQARQADRNTRLSLELFHLLYSRELPFLNSGDFANKIKGVREFPYISPYLWNMSGLLPPHLRRADIPDFKDRMINVCARFLK